MVSDIAYIQYDKKTACWDKKKQKKNGFIQMSEFPSHQPSASGQGRGLISYMISGHSPNLSNFRPQSTQTSLLYAFARFAFTSALVVL